MEKYEIKGKTYKQEFNFDKNMFYFRLKEKVKKYLFKQNQSSCNNFGLFKLLFKYLSLYHHLYLLVIFIIYRS